MTAVATPYMGVAVPGHHPSGQRPRRMGESLRGVYGGFVSTMVSNT